MAWPFSKSAAPAAPPRTLDRGNGLCLMQHAWRCTSRRRQGSCYCSGHTCGHAGCINVVSGPQARHCQRHQILEIAPRPAAPHAHHGGGAAPEAQMKRINQVLLAHHTRIDAEDRRVAVAFATLAQSPELRKRLHQETTTGMQILDLLSSHELLDDLYWEGVARFLQEQMHVYIRDDKNFAAHLCQDLLLFCSAKIDKAHLQFVLFVTKLMVLPLLGPAVAGVSAAAGAAGGVGGEIASTVTGKALNAGASGVITGAGKGAQKALDITPDRYTTAGQPVYTESQGTVNDVVEYFNKLRASPITLVRVMSMLLAENATVRASEHGKAVLAHFGPQFPRWYKLLDR